MSSNYPDPPAPVQQRFDVIYPSSANTQQIGDPTQPDQLRYGNLSQPLYPQKVESHAPQDHIASNGALPSTAQGYHQHPALHEHQRQQMQHAAQLVQQQPTDADVSAGLPLPQTQSHGTPDQGPKSNRLRKACDSCSARKVKCDESGPPCRACSALEIPCTFDRPSRRRGPPNRHAEAIKRRRLEDAAGESDHFSGLSAPSSPTHAAQALAALSSQPSAQQVSAESICPAETLDLLIDDFFTYIHPLCPFPHEPSFREAWKRREDLSNKSFLALLSAMVGALVASFPRKPRLDLKAHKRDTSFPNHMGLINRCQHVCSLARGPGYLESEGLSVYDAATSYFLALISVYTSRWRLGRLYFGECVNIIRNLGLHRLEDANRTQIGAPPTLLDSQTQNSEAVFEQPVDNITLQMGRRIFWTLFVSVKSMQQLGPSFGELVIPPPTSTEPYPPLPDPVDDFCIYPTHNEPQPPGLLPIIAGFNANVSVYCSYNPLATMELAWGSDAVVDWERQKRVLFESLRRCKGSTSELPPQLTVHPTVSDSGQFKQQNGGALPRNFAQPILHRDPAQSLMGAAHQTEALSPEERRQTQYEIQRSNIYASSLSSRSYIVEKFFNLCEAHDRTLSLAESAPSSPSVGVAATGIDEMVPHHAPTSSLDGVAQEMRLERESIVKALLAVLSSINYVNMEPNADSFTSKIRSIAGALLDSPDQRKGPIALQSQEPLSAFLKIIMSLERVSPANSDLDQAQDDDAELRQWAELRECQLKFAQQGGLVGMS